MLVVVPPPDGAVPGITPATSLAGLSLLRRLVLAARAAGYQRVLVGDGAGEAERLLADSGATILRAQDAPPALTASRVVLVPYNVVPQARWLSALR